MSEERFRKYLAFRSPELLGGADTRELADDLTREWDGATYVRVDVADAEVEQLRSLNQTQADSIETFQSQFRVMKEAIEAGIQHIELVGVNASAGFPDDAEAIRRYVLARLKNAITPEGSEK